MVFFIVGIVVKGRVGRNYMVSIGYFKDEFLFIFGFILVN